MIMTLRKGPSTVSKIATAAEPTYTICRSDVWGDWQITQNTPTGSEVLSTGNTFQEALQKYIEGEKLFASLPSF